MRGTTVFNDSSCFVWFHAGLTHACNDNFSMIVRELSVSSPLVAKNSILLCSSHPVSFLFPPVSVHTDVESFVECFHFFRSFPLEREEVQTLRCAISSRTRAVDGISPNLILGVSRENEKHPRHTHHHFPLHLLF